MTIHPLGERALILRDVPGDPAAYAAAIGRLRPPGLVEAVASYDTVGIYFEPPFDPSILPTEAASAENGRRHGVAAGPSKPPERTPLCASSSRPSCRSHSPARTPR